MHRAFQPHSIALMIATVLIASAWLGRDAFTTVLIAPPLAFIALLGIGVLAALCGVARPVLGFAMRARFAITALLAVGIAPEAIAIPLASLLAIEVLLDEVGEKVIYGRFAWEALDDDE